ncbi:hypothetical protein QY96_02933 [Bacillus thermotolerans]|nr:hypothetical protein QY96_02933 [Bacillus thermotolerans]
MINKTLDIYKTSKMYKYRKEYFSVFAITSVKKESIIVK